MTTTFNIHLKLTVTHENGTFIDENSVKGLVGNLIRSHKNKGPLCQYDGKLESDIDTFTVTVSKIKDKSSTFDLSDMVEYL